nr:hypothetical protein [Tepidiforma sp.]
MDVTRATVEEFLELLRKDPELRERAREIIVAADWERVDRAIERMAAEIAAFAAETRAHIAEVERTTNTRFNDMTGKFEALRNEMDRRFEATDAKIDALRTDMNQRFEAADAKVEGLRTDMIQRFEAADVKVEGLRTDMNQRFEQVDQRFEQVDQRFEQVDQRFEQVDQRFERVEARLDSIEKRLARVEGELGNLTGGQIEDRLSHEPGKYLGRPYRKVRKIIVSEDAEVDAAIEAGVLSEDEYQDVLRADVVVRVTPRRGEGSERVVVVEASKVVDRGDVERAARRAALLGRVWPGTEGAVFGYAITAGARELAEASGVRVLVERTAEETAEEGAA